MRATVFFQTMSGCAETTHDGEYVEFEVKESGELVVYSRPAAGKGMRKVGIYRVWDRVIVEE